MPPPYPPPAGPLAGPPAQNLGFSPKTTKPNHLPGRGRPKPRTPRGVLPEVTLGSIWGICGRASMFWVHLPGLRVYLPGLRTYLPGLRVYLPGLCVGTFGVSAVGLRCFGSGLRGCGSISQGCAPISQGCASISQGSVLEGQMPCTRLAKRPLGHPRGPKRPVGPGALGGGWGVGILICQW